MVSGTIFSIYVDNVLLPLENETRNKTFNRAYDVLHSVPKICHIVVYLGLLRVAFASTIIYMYGWCFKKSRIKLITLLAKVQR